MKRSSGEIDSACETRTLFAILASGFIVTLGVGLFSFTLPLVSLDEKISGAWLGSGFAGYFLARFLAAPIAGICSDKTNPRKPLLVGSLLGTIAPLGYFIYPSIVVLYGIQFVMGLVSGGIKPIGMAVIGGNVDEGRLAHWFAVHALLFNIAIFVGPILGGFLYLDRSMCPILLGLSVCMGGAACIIFWLVPSYVQSLRNIESQTSSDPVHRINSMALFIAIGGRALGIGLMAAFYPILIVTALGQKGIVVGVLFSIPNLAVCLCLPIVARYVGRQVPSIMTFVGMLLSMVGLLFLGQSHVLWEFVVWGCVMGLGASVSIPASMALVSGVSPHQGKLFGSAHAAAGIGFMVGPLLGGLVVQHAHAAGFAFQLAALVGGICCLPLLAGILRRTLYFGRGVAWGGAGLCALVLLGLGWMILQPQVGNSNHMAANVYRYTDVAMGTVVNLTLAAESRTAADNAARKSLAFMRDMQKDFDFRNPNGSVGRINSAARGTWVEPTRQAYELLHRTSDFSRTTDGVFDPTIGAVTTSPLYYILDESIALSKKDLVDYRLVAFEEGKGRIRLEKQGMALDLGGIAKGAIIDATVKLLRGLNIQAGIVEAGGDFYCFGDRNWTVGIRHPRVDAVYETITVQEKGVCGSGDYQQFVILEDKGQPALRHHIFNPADMEPADKSTGVTVIAENAELADALATTLFIMGPSQGKAFVHEHYPDASAMWFTPDISVVMTANFPKE